MQATHTYHKIVWKKKIKIIKKSVYELKKKVTDLSLYKSLDSIKKK